MKKYRELTKPWKWLLFSFLVFGFWLLGWSKNFFFFLKKKIQNGRLKKRSFSSSANSQYFFMKISGIGPWVSRIGWCEGHWCCLTYMVVRLSDIRSKTAKKCLFCVLGHFWAYVGQPHGHIGWAKPMPFASINPTNPRTNPWNFHEKILRIGGAGKWPFFESAILNFFFQNKFFFCFILMKISQHL